MKTHFWINLLLIISLVWPFSQVQAQDADPGGPVYIVEPGDTLWGIAQRFGLSMDALASRNGITDPSQLDDLLDTDSYKEIIEA